MRKAITRLLIVIGVTLAVVAAVWWGNGRPPTHLADTDYVVCRALEIQQGIHEGITACQHAAGPVAGPAVMAGTGAFLLLLGAILYTGRQAGTVVNR